jgi:amidase
MGDFAHDQDWRVLVAAKKESQQSAIPPEWLIDSKVLHELKQCPGGRLLETSPAKKSTILTDEELEITERYSATDLLEKLGKGELTSVAVTRAFCKRAAVAQQLVRLAAI